MNLTTNLVNSAKKSFFLCRTCVTKSTRIPMSGNMSADQTSDDQLIIGQNFQDIDVNSFKDLMTNNDMKDKIELIITEYEYEKYTTLRVPNTLTVAHMKDLLNVSEANDRKKMFNFCMLNKTKGIRV